MCGFRSFPDQGVFGSGRHSAPYRPRRRRRRASAACRHSNIEPCARRAFVDNDPVMWDDRPPRIQKHRNVRTLCRLPAGGQVVFQRRRPNHPPPPKKTGMMPARSGAAFPPSPGSVSTGRFSGFSPAFCPRGRPPPVGSGVGGGVEGPPTNKAFLTAGFHPN